MRKIDEGVIDLLLFSKRSKAKVAEKVENDEDQIVDKLVDAEERNKQIVLLRKVTEERIEEAA